jgi:hypothetical protein
MKQPFVDNFMYIASLISIFTCCLGAVRVARAQGETKVHVTGHLEAKGRNNHYSGNRAPLLASPLTKLPVGAIKPDGWLRRQLELMRDGFTGHLAEISKWCNFEKSAWVSPEGIGENGWEELPYWLKGFISLGYVLEDKRIIAEANRWIEGVFSSQEAGGSFGPRENWVKHDIWPNMVTLYALRTYYEATKDKKVIQFMKRYCHWLMTIPLDQYLPKSWQKIRGGDNLDHIYWLYNQTGEQWLLDLARVNHERTADWTGGIPSWHGVNICQCFREPAEYYQQIHDIRYLHATERNYQDVMSVYGQVPGGMFGADENARQGFTGSRQGAETCSMVEFMHSDEMLVAITGNPLWADRCEEVAFNSLPASMMPDLKGLHYLTAPNMVQLDRIGKAPMVENDGDMLSYNPWSYRCCQHNVAFGWPYFAEHLWMATKDNGLAAVFYASNKVKARVGGGTQVQITETTPYPFDEVVEFKLSAKDKARFPFSVRIPGWCSNARVQINGKDVVVKANPQSWVTLERTWKNGDVVRLELPQIVTVKVWRQNNNAVSVLRGPLAYSLKIGEQWQRHAGTDQWPAYEVFPATPWNYGLILDMNDPATSFEVVKKSGELVAQPFALDNAPVELHAKGRRIVEWKLESNGFVGSLQDSPAYSAEPVENVTLIPMGCARLRISVFPTVSEDPNAKKWK